MTAAIDDTLSYHLEKAEKALNFVGYIPFVSTLSAGARVLLGKAEIIGAVVVAAFLALKALFNPDSAQRARQMEQAAKFLVKYASHGGANILRSSLEAMPFLSLITCLPYDLMGYRFSYHDQTRHIVNLTEQRARA